MTGKKLGAFSRKVHRWMGFYSAIFLLALTITGIGLSIQKLAGVADNAREEREMVGSGYVLDTSLAGYFPKLARAQATVRAKVGNVRLTHVELELQGEHPIFVIHTRGKGEPEEFVVNAETGAIEGKDSDEKSMWERLHGGEILGDYGVAFNLVVGVVFLLLILSGLVMHAQLMGARMKAGAWKAEVLPKASATEATSGDRSGGNAS